MRHPYNKPAVMQHLQLSIPEPCHENWQHMTPTQQGRYCNACAKEVVDFSMMTDTEVLNYFTTLTHEKVCGRALPAQLDRIIARPKEPVKRLFWYWNYLVMFFMFFSKTNTVKAQGGIRTVTELSPVKPVDDNIGEGIITSWVVKGKVTDIDGNPVPFATIKIRGNRAGFSADAGGAYSIRVKTADLLIISAIGFKGAEVPVGTHTLIYTVLDKPATMLTGDVVVVTASGMHIKNVDDNIMPVKQKFIAAIKVMEDRSGLPVEKARIIVAKGSDDQPDTLFTDKKGFCKLKKLKGDEEYFIKVEAEGYGVSEFTINADNFKDKKKNWEVLLTRQVTELPGNKSSVRKTCPGATVLLGAVSVIANSSEPLYVVDGTIMPGSVDINSDDVEEYSILKGPEATALFGPDGSNGAIVITTRKAKEKTLDSVIIVSEFGIRKTTHCVVSCLNTDEFKTINDSGITIINDSNESLKGYQDTKIYPNPVERGNSLNIDLKLKQAGSHNIQITDAAGRIILQKQIKAAVKDHSEKIPVDNKWSGGIYYIRVFDAKNQLISKSSFIVR